MFIEDIILTIRSQLFPDNFTKQRAFGGVLSDDWTLNFILSLGQAIDDGRALSSKQSTACLKIINRVRSQLTNIVSKTELDQLLSNPQTRHPIYESTSMPREVRYIGGNLLAFRFKWDEQLRDHLKLLGVPAYTNWYNRPNQFMPPNLIQGLIAAKPRYDWLYKIWIVPVYRFNLAKVIETIKLNRFSWDGRTANYIKLANGSFNQPSLFAVDAENDIIVTNVCDDPILAAWITEVAGGTPL